MAACRPRPSSRGLPLVFAFGKCHAVTRIGKFQWHKFQWHRAAGTLPLTRPMPVGGGTVTRIPNPIRRRRELGNLLREHRERKDLTLAQVAKDMLCSSAKLSRIENGQRLPTARDMRDLLALYEISVEADRRHLAELFEQAREKEPGDYNAHPLIVNYVSYEIEAIAIRDFKGSAIPGLLQTEAYANAIIQSFFSAEEPMVTSRLVKSRLDRQQVVFNRPDPPQLHSVLDEAAVRRIVGGREVMREQLARLLTVGEQPNITIQVIPFEAGAHPGMENTFTIFDLEGEAENDTIAYSEDVIGTVQLEKAADLQNSVSIFEKVTELAMSPDESASLIREALQKMS